MISIDKTASLLVLSLLFTFLLINIVYSLVGYSLVLSGTYSADIAVALEDGSIGASQISVNGTTVNVTLVSNMEDYVDIASDVDSSLDKGMHNNFPAEQAGLDSNFDTLTEKNTEAIIFQQVTVDPQQATSDTAWTDVPGARVRFLIRDFNKNRKFTLLSSALISILP